jgi:hypothetical protein
MLSNPLFGVLLLERDPFTFANLPGLFQSWLMDAGGFAAVGLVVYLIYALFTPTDKSQAAKERAGVSQLMVMMAICSLLTYVVVGVLIWTGKGENPAKQNEIFEPGYVYKYVAPELDFHLRPLLMSLAGLFAIIGFGEPFARAAAKLSFRRIYAIAKLSFLEAIRSKFFLIFLIALIPYLFPTSWFNNAIKPEDELRSLVTIPYIVMQLLVLISALLMTSFSIPNDIKRQTIYTIVTKPVQRLEIFLGRFAGFMFVLTLGLIFMVVAGLLFISTTSIDEAAKKETYLARVPVRAGLEFRSRKADFVGTLVGKEFEYRKYIGGDPTSPQRAIWNFPNVPSSLASETKGVKCEFTFDIFRLTKGEENKGVFVTVTFATHACPQVPPTEARDGYWKWEDRAKEDEYRLEAVKLLTEATGKEQNVDSVRGVLGGAKPNTKEWAIADQLAEKYGFFEVPSEEVYDFHPKAVLVPAGIFKNARAGTVGIDERTKKDLPRLQVFVKCESRSQMLGMAAGDLYLLEGEKTFEENYAKSMFGLWCRIAIAIAIALCLSTYLSGVISLLTAMMLYAGGYAIEHIEDVARGTSTGGGPFQSITSMLKAEQPTMQVGDTAIDKLNSVLDVGFQWFIRRLQNVVPDVEGYAWSHFVREGFNVNYEFLAMNLICLIGYLLPWTVLAFYLLRSREVADT